MHIYYLIVSVGQSPVWDYWMSWVLFSGSHQAEIKMSAGAVILSVGWGSSFQAHRLWAEFSSLWL